MPDVEGRRIAAISPGAVRKELEKVLASSGFLNAERLSRLLTFVVGQVVERGATDISEYLIADEVFQRRDSFDPRIDSIVRVEMRRLRAQLSGYYETEGRNDSVEIYFLRKGYVPAFRSRRRQTRSSPPSIGVLPLEDLGADPAQEYLAEGLTDTLITELAKLDGVRVISRTTVVQYKRTNKPIPVIGRELALDYIVEGTVNRCADHARITVQLVDVHKDRHIWADCYELELVDVLKVQRDLVRAVVREMRIKLTPQDRARLAPSRRVNSRAYDALLKGTYAWHQFSREGFETSIRFFRQATEEDPAYALAHAWLANALHVLILHGYMDPFEMLPAGEAAARKALQLDDMLAEAHAVVAAYEAAHWNWTAADRGFRRALHLKPGWAHGHHMYAVLCLLLTRRLSEAVHAMERAFELDPLSLPNAIQFARIRICRREYDLAIAILKDFFALNPNSAELNRWLGDAYAAKGLYMQAAEAYARARSISPVARDAWRLAQVYRACGSLDRARESVREIQQLCAGNYVLPSTAALTSLALGENDDALDWLAKATQMRDPALPFVVVLPVCDPVSADARFRAILRTIGVNDR